MLSRALSRPTGERIRESRLTAYRAVSRSPHWSTASGSTCSRSIGSSCGSATDAARDEQYDPRQLVGSSALDDRPERPAPHVVVSKVTYPVG